MVLSRAPFRLVLPVILSVLVSLPVVAIRGLSALTDLPSNITLAPNPALIDANREVSAGVRQQMAALETSIRTRVLY